MEKVVKKPSIINLPVKLGFILVVLVTLLGLLSSLKGYHDFLTESKKIEKIEIEARKTELKKDIQRILALIDYQRSQTEERLKRILASRIDEAFGLIHHLYDQYREKMSAEELRILIRESLRDIRFHDGRGYYFATRVRDGYEILCATCTYMENKILLDWKDKKGNPVIQDMIDIVTTRGEGFYTYYWTKPSEEGTFPKIAYVKLFEPFGWIIGTGEYLDTMERDIQRETLETLQEIDVGKGKYFFVLDREGRFLAHPDPSIIGRSLVETPAIDGARQWESFEKAAGNPLGDYVTYPWTNSWNEEVSEKLSYVTGVDDWQWIVGTGVLLKDILPGLTPKRAALREGILRQIVFYAANLIVGIAILLLAARRMKKKVRSDAVGLVAFLGKAAQVDQQEVDYVDVKSFNFKEFASIGEYSNWLIQERITKEQALAENEAMLRSVFQAAPIGIGVTKDRVFKWCNEKFLEITGYPMEDIQGHSTRLLYADDREFERVHRVKQPQVEEHGVAAVVTRWKHKDGRNLDILLSSAAVMPGDSNAGLVFTALDITERKTAQKALQQSEERYRNLVEQTLDGYFICEIPSGQILFLNQRICELFGYSMEEGLSFTIWDVLASREFSQIKNRIQSLIRGEIPQHDRRILEARRKNGSTFRAEVLTSRIRYNGKDTLQGVLRDVTERDRLEAQFQQAQRIDAIGILAGGIAHDFNNILGIILGNSDLANINLPEDNPARNHLDEIRKACLRARDMVQQILTFSRKGEREYKPIQISPIIKESMKFLRASIPSTIEIRHLFSATAETILGDATQINQVLINLCTNAAHAMREKGGILEIRLENVQVDTRMAENLHGLETGKYLRLTVKDTGHGMAPDVLDKVFDPYFTTKNVGEGTGMGLAVVHGIVQTHGGAIALESDQEKGTRFGVYLPLYVGDDSELESDEPGRIIPSGRERILLVEDERSLLDIENKMLEHLGYVVEAKTSSLEALEIFQKNPNLFDAVITDQTMPHMTGKELAKEILSLRSDIPIILCTGYSELINEDQARAMGIKKYVTKPVEIRELASILRSVFDGKAPL
jgi:PAS domain S-box-containing protein